MVLELPASVLGAEPEVRIWGRCSVRRDGQLVHTARDGRPTIASIFNTDETKEEYNRGSRFTTGSASSISSFMC